MSRHTALVTGAAGGLGLEVARLLAASGTCVVGVDLERSRLEAGFAQLQGEVHAVGADLSDTRECDRVVAAAQEHGPVRVLVNCAAVLHRVDLFEVDEEGFARVVNTNLRSAFWLCRGVIPGMRAAGGGRIVNVTSVGIHTGGYSLTSAVYEMTKAALSNLSKTLARSLAPDNILVNTVAPGAMRTRMLTDQTPSEVLAAVERDIPLGRLAEPVEVARVVAFLADQDTTYVTGATFDANGGLIMP